MYRGRPSRRSGNGMLYFAAIHAASQFLQLPRKPPVTAALIVANTLIYLRPGRLNEILPYWQDVCLQPYLVIQGAKALWWQLLSYLGGGDARRHPSASPLLRFYEPLCYLLSFYFGDIFPIFCDGQSRNLSREGKGKDLRRLFLSAFYHVDDVHLVFNMMSLMWKGIQLEGRYGSRKFAIMVGTLLGLSHGLVVLSAKLLSKVADVHGPMHECAVGFSAVLFALKVVLNYNSPTYTSVYGILVPSRYAAWAEVLLVQLLVPGSSFLGHLCGILAGLIYVHAADAVPPGFPASNSLWRFAALPLAILMWPIRWISWPFRGRSSGYVGSRRTGTRRPLSGVAWRCPACTFDNRVSQEVCEMCDTPRFYGGQNIVRGDTPGETAPSAPPWQQSGSLSVEELRNARIARFTR